MAINIPNPENPIMRQTNRSSILGDLEESFNLNLTTDLGKIKTAKCLTSTSEDGLGTTDGLGGALGQPPYAFSLLNNTNITFSSGQRQFTGGNSPSDSFSLIAGSGVQTSTMARDDMKYFNGLLWVTTGASGIVNRYNGTSWTSTASLNGGSHLFATHDKYLYFTDENYKIKRIDTSNVVATTTGTMNFNMPGFVISFIKSDGNDLWIGMINISASGGGKTYVFKWDGQTQDIWQAQYLIEARGIFSGVIVDGVPHILDTNGRMLAFNGGTFIELARFPLPDGQTFIGQFSEQQDLRAVHPNGMAYDSVNEEILINISSIKSGDTYPTWFDFPSGVWSYKKESGLTHKLSPSIQPIADSGETNLDDYGQYNVRIAGAIDVLKNATSSSEKGRIVFGATIQSESATTDTTSVSGLFTDDTAKTSQSLGFFTTNQIFSNRIADTWQKIYVMYRNFLTSTDKCVVKYKTEESTPTKCDITWTDLDRFTTTTDLSAYEKGDDIQLIQGFQSGRNLIIESISENAGTYTVIVDEDLPSNTVDKSSVARIDKWILAGTITNEDNKQYKALTLPTKNISPWVQFKVVMRFTGDNELYRLRVINKTNIEE